ncbi:unnamed protein product [Kuraishia capsulata CBS 1993]|uniref:HECT-type E3 ubiquitin transferase n=1 Tax=Kuraishia capsulata CBS 1993 TaxID=1382522 RepID=W6MK59_9ASCO|nr:uncharacterized protein KUCA_T00002680001 [Kuraishia capsulata CBS 1993]CDK26706.1 unnamed protein product [Kuraishia capsulata CBS 1993]
MPLSETSSLSSTSSPVQQPQQTWLLKFIKRSISTTQSQTPRQSPAPVELCRDSLETALNGGDSVPLASVGTNASPGSQSRCSASSSASGTILDSCKCCGTIIKYPTEVCRIKCMVCQTTMTVRDKRRPTGVGIEEETEQELPQSYVSYAMVKELIAQCRHSTKTDSGPKNGTPHAVFQPMELALQNSFKSFKCLNNSFRVDRTQAGVSYHSPNIKFDEARKVFNLLSTLPTVRPYFKVLLGALDLLRHPPDLGDPASLRWLLILLEIPLLSDSLVQSNVDAPVLPSEIRVVAYEILKRIIGLLAHLEKRPSQYLCHWWSRLPHDEFVKKVDFSNLYITFQLTRLVNYDMYDLHPKDKKGTQYSADVVDDVNYKSAMNGSPMRNLEALKPLHAALPMSPSGRRINLKGKDGEIKIRLAQYSSVWHLRTAGRVLALLFSANTRGNKNLPKVSTSNFYNSLVDYVNVKQDFDAWQFNSGTAGKVDSSNADTSLQSVIEYLQSESSTSYLGISTPIGGGNSKKARFTFCQFPFLLSLGAKISILEYEAKRQMERKAEEAFIHSINKKVPIDVYFRVRVRRDHITADSIRSIKSHPNDLKKLLRVEFVEEPGVDAGGLKKEWFLILTKELFHPDKGMFAYNEKSNLGWFTVSNSDKDELYYLVGVVLGLAIYNSTILDLSLPKALYKKLLNKKVGLDDFLELDPEAGMNLKKLLKMSQTEPIEEFELYFDVTYKDLSGETKVAELKENGSNIKVTHSNKHEYVQRYVSFFLNDVTKQSYESFSKGFQNVIGGNALSLFSPEEIQLILIGDNNDGRKIDVDVLKSVTKYNGWVSAEMAASSFPVKWFWEYFEHLSSLGQRKLLLFITGSDRIPATGLPTLNFKITKIRGDQGRLPIAHTCFNELCLYDYENKDTFFRKLDFAVHGSEGFGLR